MRDNYADEATSNCDPDCAERTKCRKAGQAGHWQCGRCTEHGEPRHHCGCMTIPSFTQWGKPKPMCATHPGQLRDHCGPCRSEQIGVA